MVKDEKKSKKAASAARASQMLAQQGSPANSTPIGFGFGGYVGSQNLSEALGANSAQGFAPPVLDPELQLHVKRLSKKDSTTTTRALQNLKELIGAQPEDQLKLLLPVWSNIYPRLANDNARGVREAAAKFQGALCAKAGKSLAPYLKQLMGPWMLQQHDLHPEVAKSAAWGLTSVFPAQKLNHAITFCSAQVAEHVVGLANSSPEALGDPQRESPEELQERYERTVASALASLASLVTTCSSGEGKEASLAAQEFVQQQGFGKKYLASKSSLIRRQSYHLIAALAEKSPGVLEQSRQALAPRVFAAISDKDASTHKEMWGMLLNYCKAFPGAVLAVDFKKSLLPNLVQFLKNACYGSGSSSYQAIYPFLTCIPTTTLVSSDAVMLDIIGSVLQGAQKLSQQQTADAEACFLECFQYFRTQEGKRPLTESESLQRTFAKEVFKQQLLPLVFSNDKGRSALGCRLFSKALHLTQCSDSLKHVLGSISSNLQSRAAKALQAQQIDESAPQTSNGPAAAGRQELASLTELLSALDVSEHEPEYRHQVQSYLGQPLMDSLSQDVGNKSSHESLAMMTQLMQSLGVSGSHTDLTRQAAVQALQVSSGQEGSGEASEEAQSAWVEFLATSIAHSPQPGAILVSTLQSLMKSTMGRSKVLHAIRQLLQRLDLQMSSKPTKSSTDHLDAFLASLAPVVRNGNDKEATVLGCLLSSKFAVAHSTPASRESAIVLICETLQQELDPSTVHNTASSEAVLMCLRNCVLSPVGWEAGSYFNSVMPASGGRKSEAKTGHVLISLVLKCALLDTEVANLADKIWDHAELLRKIALWSGIQGQAKAPVGLEQSLKETFANLVHLFLARKEAILLKRLAQKLADYQHWANTSHNIGRHYYFIVLEALGMERACASKSEGIQEVIIWDTDNPGEQASARASLLLMETFVCAGFDTTFKDIFKSSETEEAAESDIKRLSYLASSLLCASYSAPENEYQSYHSTVAEKFHDGVNRDDPVCMLLLQQTLHRLRAPVAMERSTNAKLVALDHTIRAALSRNAHPGRLAPIVQQWVEEQAEPFHISTFADSFSLLSEIVRYPTEEVAESTRSALSHQNEKNIQAALKSVPLWRALEAATLKKEETFLLLETILAYLPTQHGPVTPQSPSEEKEALLQLCEQAMSSFDGLKRQRLLTSSGQNSLRQTEDNREDVNRATDIHARLLSAAFCYSSEKMSTEFQRRACTQIRELLRPAMLSLEEAAESLGEAVLSTISGLHTDIKGAQEAFETLKRLKTHLEGLAAQDLQEKSHGIETVLLDQERLRGDADSSHHCLEAALSLLTHTPEEVVGQVADSLVSDLIRCVLAVGCVISVGQMTKKEAVLLEWLEEIASILNPLAACCAAVSSAPASLLLEAAHAVDEWSADTGVDCVGACLAILSAGLVLPDESLALQRLAIQMLTMPEISKKLNRNVEEEDEEELGERQAQAEESGRVSQILTAYGLRSDLALHLEEQEEWSERDDSLLWAVLLIHILDLPTNSTSRQSICQALHTAPRLVETFMQRIVWHLPQVSVKDKQTPQNVTGSKLEAAEAARVAAQARAEGLGGFQSSSQPLRDALKASEDLSLPTLAEALYGAALRALPGSVRAWYQSLADKKQSSALEAYTIARESRLIILDELAGVSGNVTQQDESDEGTIEISAKAKLSRREAVAQVSVEGETIMELVIQLPESWPLEGAKLECRKGVGIAESRRRKWMLNISALLRSHVTLSDAISVWQKNCARQFAGVEECLICYNVILAGAGSGQLPKLCCKTCGKKFHNGCLYKWFRTSHKSVCPHCQSPW